MTTERRGVQSIEVGGRLLQVMIEAERPLMLRELASGAKLAPAQAHAYLVSFRKQGLVEQDASAGRYRLGPFALLLGVARMRSFDPLEMAGEAVAGFAQQIGFTVALAVWGTHGPTIVHVHEGPEPIYTNTRAGIVYSVSGTATGRVFSAYMSETLIRNAIELENAEGARSKRIGRSVPFRTVKHALQRIRELGFATIDPPPVPGVSALSAPVFDHVGQIRMAVTVIGPANYLDTSDASPTAATLLTFAADLSARLGFQPARTSDVAHRAGETWPIEPADAKAEARRSRGARAVVPPIAQPASPEASSKAQRC
jgi:DNA-binding IclR family transcriptional regulator